MHRREFLGAAAATAALAVVPPLPAAAPGRKLRKAIMYSTIGMKGSVLERFTAMKAAGFEGVEPLGAMNREEVVAAFQATGLGAASVCCHIH
ncbi:MAG: sugar phosphate isomerase/epimerase, partial [Opitutaceae bacterium]